MDYNKIGEYIQSKRKALGMTQADLGDKLGVSSKAVSKWECGVALPDVSLFSGLCEILKIEVSELLEGKDKEKIPMSKKKNIAIISLSILSIVLLILSLVFGLYFIKNYDAVHIYDIKSGDDRFAVEGRIISIDNTQYIAINNIALRSTDDFSAYYVGYELYFKDKIVYKKEKKSEEDIEMTLRDYMCDISFVITSNEKINYDNLAKQDYFLLRIKFINAEGLIKNLDIRLSIQ